MTGKEKIKQMLDSGEFAEEIGLTGLCPMAFGLKDRCKVMDGLTWQVCKDCWRKALESEVEG